jgi:hypothetical protein
MRVPARLNKKGDVKKGLREFVDAKSKLVKIAVRHVICCCLVVCIAIRDGCGSQSNYSEGHECMTSRFASFIKIYED